MPLGFVRRKAQKDATAGRQFPVWTQGSDSIVDQEAMDTHELFANQAMRYTRSDLVYMCVNRIAEMAGQQAHKLKIFNSSSERDPLTNIPKEEITDHEFLSLWTQPNLWTDTFGFVEAWAIMLQLAGNVYWHLDDGSEPKPADDSTNALVVDLLGQPKDLWMVRSDLIRPIGSKDAFIDHYLYEREGRKIKFLPDSILHFKRFHPLEELLGLSPVEPANYAAVSDVAAQRLNWALFKNQMRLSGIVESPRDEVDPAQVEMMEKMLLKKYAGDPEKAHQVAFLWSDFKYTDLGMNLRDAEYINGAKLNRMRIFGVFGVHPAIVISEDVNRANAEVGEYVTLKFTVEPMLRRLALGLTKILRSWEKTKPAKRERPKVEAHFIGVVPRDDVSEAQASKLTADTVDVLIKALGPDAGVKEAQRQGLLPEDMDPADVKPMGGGHMGGGPAGNGGGWDPNATTPEGKSYP